MERFFQSGVALTKANTGLLETYSSRCSVSGLAPAGRASRVTTPLNVEELELLVDVEVADGPEPTEDPERLEDPEKPEPPDGYDSVADGDGEGYGVFVPVGVGVGRRRRRGRRTRGGRRRRRRRAPRVAGGIR